MKTLALFLALLAGLPAAESFAAGSINITTYYDVPDGDFKDITVTGVANQDITLGSDPNSVVSFGAGGGSTTIGTTSPPPVARTLTVRGDFANRAPASFMDATNRTGVQIGAPQGAAYGIVSGRANSNVIAPLYINSSQGGNVNVGSAPPSLTNQLQVSGTIGIKEGNNPEGQVKVAWAAGSGQSGYYATYAP